MAPRTTWLVTEFCDGGSLESFIRAQTSTPLDVVRHFFRDINAALGALRAVRLMLRCVQASDFLLQTNAASGRPFPFNMTVKLAGLMDSRFVGSTKNTTFVVDTKPVSPEIRKNVPYTDKACLYSVGLLLQYTATGEMTEPMDTTTCTHNVALSSSSSEDDDFSTEDVAIVLPESVVSDPLCQAFTDLLAGLLRPDETTRIEWSAYFKHPFFGETPCSAAP